MAGVNICQLFTSHLKQNICCPISNRKVCLLFCFVCIFFFRVLSSFVFDVLFFFYFSLQVTALNTSESALPCFPLYVISVGVALNEKPAYTIQKLLLVGLCRLYIYPEASDAVRLTSGKYFAFNKPTRMIGVEGISFQKNDWSWRHWQNNISNSVLFHFFSSLIMVKCLLSPLNKASRTFTI